MPQSTPPINPFKKTKAAAKWASTFGIAAIILAILAGILAWFSWKEVNRITTTVRAYAGQITQQTKSSTQVEQTTLSKLQNQLNTLQTQFDHLQNTVDQLSNINVKVHNQRLLNETSYLIHRANWQLTISQNTETALQLMKLAHEQLKAITNSNITTLKQAVAKDIISLEKTPRLDVTQLLARLDQLKTDVLKLPSRPTQTTTTIQPNNAQETTTKSPWHKKWWQRLSALKELVIIRHEKRPIKPLLSDQQLLFLKQNVQLKISEAEWAVLYQNTAMYQQSLQQARQMLETYYPNQEALADTLKHIQVLSKINIKPTLPNLSNTLTILSHTTLGNKK